MTALADRLLRNEELIKASIDGIEIDCLIDESTLDTSEVATRPIEEGFSVATNAIHLAYELQMLAYFQNTENGNWREKKAALEEIKLQVSEITIATRSRVYPNMVLTSIRSVRDARSSQYHEVLDLGFIRIDSKAASKRTSVEQTENVADDTKARAATQNSKGNVQTKELSEASNRSFLKGLLD